MEAKKLMIEKNSDHTNREITAQCKLHQLICLTLFEIVQITVQTQPVCLATIEHWNHLIPSRTQP